jgi:hypothetical protein
MRMRVHKLVRLAQDGLTAERIDDPPPGFDQPIPIPAGTSIWRNYRELALANQACRVDTPHAFPS